MAKFERMRGGCRPISYDYEVVAPAFEDHGILWPSGRAATERIVRCRDCKHFDESDGCTYWTHGLLHANMPDKFCAWGEERSI